MRPTRLVAQGFGALRDRIELDLSDIDFFALVGPTGAGKSTVIDAICFALYGSVPRYGDQRITTAVVSALALEARIELEFLCAGQRFRVVRVVRKSKGANKVQLDRLDDDGALVQTLADSARDVLRHVESLVGLDFSQFTKCVVLPQGAFSALLHETEGKRNELLVKLLDLGIYDQIGTLAGQRANALANEINVIEGTLARLEVVDDATLATATSRHEELLEVLAACNTLLADDREIATRAERARDEAERSRRAVAATRAVELPSDFTESITAARELTALAAAATDELDRLRAELDHFAADLADLPDRVALEQDMRTHRDRIEADAAAKDAATAVQALEPELAAAGLALQGADAELAAAQSARDDVRRQHAAHALRPHLSEGAPCPVCDQIVRSLPIGTQPGELNEADARAEAAASARDRSETDLREIERRHAAAGARAEETTRRANELAARVGTIAGLVELEATLLAVERAEAVLADARERERAASGAERRARTSLEAAAELAKQHSRVFSAQRDAIARAGVDGLPDVGGDLASDWATLATWSVEAAERETKNHEASINEAAGLERRRTELVDPLRVRLDHLGIELPPDETVTAARDRVHAATTAAKKDLERLVDNRERARQDRERLPVARHEQQVARDLQQHLGAKRFESWLLRRAVDELARRASAHLAMLSGERYALAVASNGDFAVVDHSNGDETRPARSLSGGETFQASLALALALAEQVAELSSLGASALESIFLDEGFGTLDPEALEIVAATIEQLGSGDRMVGIVTHVAALADRVPVRFRVRTTGRTATIEREE